MGKHKLVIKKYLYIFLTLLLLCFISSSCKTTEDEDETSELPWNKPANWSGTIGPGVEY